MKDPFELITWAIAIGLAWWMLASLTGLDNVLKKLFGIKPDDDEQLELESRIEELEKRVEALEKKQS